MPCHATLGSTNNTSRSTSDPRDFVDGAKSAEQGAAQPAEAFKTLGETKRETNNGDWLQLFWHRALRESDENGIANPIARLATHELLRQIGGTIRRG